MYIYLPIAEVSMHIAVIIGLGGGVGFLSGMFGVGGGFLMTPLLIFLGVPPAIAVSTEANQLILKWGVFCSRAVLLAPPLACCCFLYCAISAK
jgi:hypothetical protein